MKKNKYITLWEASRDVACWLLKDLPEAEDIASQSLEKMLRLKKQPKHPLSWMRTTAYNASIDYFRHQKVVRNYEELALLEEKQNWYTSQEPEWGTDDQEVALQADLELFLTSKSPEVTQELYLKNFTKKSCTEISIITSRSETAIHKSYFRNLKTIKEIVARHPMDKRLVVDSLADILEASQITTMPPETDSLDD